MTLVSHELSRPLAVAEMLRKGGLSEKDVLARAVLLTADVTALQTANGRWCFLDCIRLLARICGRLVIQLPQEADDFHAEVSKLVDAAHSPGRVEFWRGSFLDHSAFSAILSVGNKTCPGLPWTTVNSNGWLARVTSGSAALPTDMDRENPIAALMAASLGVAEVFKRIYEVPNSVAPMLELTEFSLFDFSNTPVDAGPELDQSVPMPDTVIVGAGAIGNGLVLLLSQTGWNGRIHIVDNQNFAHENLGTCVLLDDHDWIESPKSERLAEWLSKRIALPVTFDVADIADARSGHKIEALSVDLLINGLDDVQARHDAQLIWPSTTVDGGINASGAAVITYRLDQPQAACLRCAYELTAVDAKAVQQRASGLDRETLQDLDQPLSARDIELAEAASRPWLSEMRAKGKTRCAVVSEGISRQLGISIQDDFRPSVPFVATAAAALAMAQTVKSVAFPKAPFVHHFQIESLFRGMGSAIATVRAPRSSCLCVTNRAIIEKLHSSRNR